MTGLPLYRGKPLYASFSSPVGISLDDVPAGYAWLQENPDPVDIKINIILPSCPPENPLTGKPVSVRLSYQDRSTITVKFDPYFISVDHLFDARSVKISIPIERIPFGSPTDEQWKEEAIKMALHAYEIAIPAIKSASTSSPEKDAVTRDIYDIEIMTNTLSPDKNMVIIGLPSPYWETKIFSDLPDNEDSKLLMRAFNAFIPNCMSIAIAQTEPGTNLRLSQAQTVCSESLDPLTRMTLINEWTRRLRDLPGDHS